MHLTVDGVGNPLRTCLTAGQRHYSMQALALLDGFIFTRVIADRGSAAASFIASVQERGSEAVIPRQQHQRANVPHDYAMDASTFPRA